MEKRLRGCGNRSKPAFGVRVHGLEFEVEGPGLVVWDSGLVVWDSGLGLQGCEYGVDGPGSGGRPRQGCCGFVDKGVGVEGIGSRV